METQKPVQTILQTMGILPAFNNVNEVEKILENLKTETYDWQPEEIDMSLIHGYYQVDGRNAEQVFQTPFENYCIAKVGKKYDLFKIGECYRPVIVPFKDNPEIKQWLEQQLGNSVIN